LHGEDDAAGQPQLGVAAGSAGVASRALPTAGSAPAAESLSNEARLTPSDRETTL